MSGRRRELEAGHLDRVVGTELEGGDAAERGDVLVLLPDRLTEPVDLDADTRGRRARAFDASSCLCARSAFNAPDRERARRTEPGARGDVGHRRDLDVGGDLRREEDLAEQSVLHVGGSATRSTLEYFSSRSPSKLWFTAMKTYFVIAAAIR